METEEEAEFRKRIDDLARDAAWCVRVQQGKAKDFHTFVAGCAQAIDAASHLREDGSGIRNAAAGYAGGKTFRDLLYISVLLLDEMTKDAVINTLVDQERVQPDPDELADVAISLKALARYAASAKADLTEGHYESIRI